MTEQHPKRIQRKRTKGWKMPEGAVYVGRPTKFGNPWSVEQYGHRTAFACYETWMHGAFVRGTLTKRPDVSELRGKDLACWCPLDQPCHADVLLELANRGEAQ